MATEPGIRRRYRVFGRVQGVGFRHFVWCEARDRGIVGWVRNRVDGSVELEAECTLETIGAFESAIARGPRWSRVERVEAVDRDPTGGAERSFEIRPTA